MKLILYRDDFDSDSIKASSTFNKDGAIFMFQETPI